MNRLFQPFLSQYSQHIAKVGGLCIVVFFLCLSARGSSGAKHDTIQRVALIIGHNQGGRALKPLRFAQQDAQKLRWILQNLGGYQAKQIHTLLAPTLQQVRQRMELIRKHASRLGRQSVFLFYYSGHAQQQYFLLGQERLPFEEVLAFVRSLPVKVRILLVDSCYSGRFLRAKGPRRLSAIQWSPPQQLQTKGLAILTSSGANSRSYESDRIQGSLFTSSLLAGLRGAADKNKDQQVSLSELHLYVYEQTLSRSLETLAGVQRPGHRIDLRGHGPLVLSRLQRAPAQLIVPTQVEGHLFVYHKGTLVQDFRKEKQAAVRMGLHAGAYQLRIRYNGWLGRYAFAVTPRTQHTLKAQKIRWQQLSIREQFKGGIYSHAPFGLGVVLQYRPISQLALNGLGVNLTLDSGRWLRAGLGYSYGPQNILATDYQTHTFSLQLAAGYGLGLQNLGLWFGAALEPVFIVRRSPTDTLWNMGFSALLVGHLDYNLGPTFGMRIVLAGGVNCILFADNILLAAPAVRMGIGLVWKP